jgi:hypothetical protein
MHEIDHPQICAKTVDGVLVSCLRNTEPPMESSTNRPHSLHSLHSFGTLDITAYEDDDQYDTEDNDAPSHLTRLRPWWRLKRFEDAAVESAYRKWHHKLWVPRLQVMYSLSALVYTGGFLNQFLSAKDSFRFILGEMRPDLKPVMVTLTVVARAMPLLLAIFMYTPARRRLLTAERYQGFVAATYVVPVLIEQSFPVLAPRFFVVADNITATPRFESWIADPSLTIRQTYYHAALCDLYGACLGALSGLYPESVALIGAVATVLNHFQLMNTYLGLDALRVKLQMGSRLPASSLNGLWLYRFMTLLWVVAISVLLDRGQRKEFSVRLQLRRAKDQRIEQLKQEKEHLDWDRKLSRLSPREVAPEQMPDASSAASCAELEMVLPQLQDDSFGARPRSFAGGGAGGGAGAGAGGDAGGDAGGGASGGASGGDAPPTQQLGLSIANLASGPAAVVAAPVVAVRLASNLNWDETRQLRTQACLPRPQSSDGSVSDACSSLGNAMGAADLDFDPLSVGPQCCSKRESALWRTLRKTGLISPTPSAASSVPGEGAPA